MKIIINAFNAFINSIRVDLELNNLVKELERKGCYVTDPNRIMFHEDMGGIECYALTKAGVRRIRSFGYNPKMVDSKEHITYTKNILLRHGYSLEKVYATPVDPVVGKTIGKYKVTRRTMGV